MSAAFDLIKRVIGLPGERIADSGASHDEYYIEGRPLVVYFSLDHDDPGMSRLRWITDSVKFWIECSRRRSRSGWEHRHRPRAMQERKLFGPGVGRVFGCRAVS